ncbi:hypothetical protein SRABI128_04962 [Microbacterium sp. Bi128]|nr:hypothetical protein SRABI128_04962 [Microbacterium sp. Bi128]
MCLGDGRDNGKAQSRALHAAARVRPAEPFEDPLLVLGGDADPVIAHPQHEGVLRGQRGAVVRRRALNPGTERDGGGRPGVLDGVRGELDQCLGEALRIRLHHVVGSFIDLPVPVGQDVHLLHDLIQELRDPDGFTLDEADLARVGEQQEVVHQALHPVHLVQQHVPGGNDIVRIIDRH